MFSFGSTAVHSTALLDEVVRVLKPGAQFVLRESVSKANVAGALHRTAKDLFTAFTLAGLVNASLKLVDASSNLVEVAAGKPKWEVGASVSLKRPAGAATKVWTVNADGDDAEPTTAKPVLPSVWTTVASDDLIDENSLLNDEDLASLAKRPVNNDDCGTGGASFLSLSCVFHLFTLFQLRAVARLARIAPVVAQRRRALPRSPLRPPQRSSLHAAMYVLLYVASLVPVCVHCRATRVFAL